MKKESEINRADAIARAQRERTERLRRKYKRKSKSPSWGLIKLSRTERAVKRGRYLSSGWRRVLLPLLVLAPVVGGRSFFGVPLLWCIIYIIIMSVVTSGIWK